MKNLKAYVVYYRGSWLGGTAFVIAASEEEARFMVEEHNDTVNFEYVKVECFDIERGVIYNWNGDY